MKRLDAMVETMRRDGTLRVFNARYQAGRAAAAAEGGFMSFGIAMARFKKALIPMLQSGKPIGGEAMPLARSQRRTARSWPIESSSSTLRSWAGSKRAIRRLVELG